MGNGGHLYLVHLHLINIVNNVGAAEEKIVQVFWNFILSIYKASKFLDQGIVLAFLLHWQIRTAALFLICIPFDY